MRIKDKKATPFLFFSRPLFDPYYPKDEGPAAYKDFNEVLRSVETADLARTVARLKARLVIKDADQSLGGAA